MLAVVVSSDRQRRATLPISTAKSNHEFSDSEDVTWPQIVTEIDVCIVVRFVHNDKTRSPVLQTSIDSSSPSMQLQKGQACSQQSEQDHSQIHGTPSQKSARSISTNNITTTSRENRVRSHEQRARALLIRVTVALPGVIDELAHSGAADLVDDGNAFIDVGCVSEAEAVGVRLAVVGAALHGVCASTSGAWRVGVLACVGCAGRCRCRTRWYGLVVVLVWACGSLG